MNYLVRYGAIPEVARFASTVDELHRGDAVVVQTHRGLQLGSVVESLRTAARSTPDADAAEPAGFTVLRTASPDDAAAAHELRRAAESEFDRWSQRIAQWGIDVQLIDLEWTLDRGKLILYVLNERGPECTRLAIQAAAAGLGVVEVQPVSSEGLVSLPGSGGGGCGTCGCHE
jgi:cell fate regulator YaaT (PSP1 superfamily)